MQPMKEKKELSLLNYSPAVEVFQTSPLHISVKPLSDVQKLPQPSHLIGISLIEM